MNCNTTSERILQHRIKPGLILITGPQGAGKSRWCLALAKAARSSGLKPRGLISPAVLDEGQKIGIDLLDLSSGERRRLAYRKDSPDMDLLIKNWHIETSTLQWGNALLEKIKSCDLFILDELGPLEFEIGDGLSAGLAFIDTHQEIPCFVVVRPSLLDRACARWPWAEVLDVTVDGRI